MIESRDIFKFRRHGPAIHALVAFAAIVSGAYAANAFAAIGESPQSTMEIEALVPVSPIASQGRLPAQGGPGWELRRENSAQATSLPNILQPATEAQVFLVPNPVEGGPGWKPLAAVEVPQGGPGWTAPDMLENLSGASIVIGQSGPEHHWQIAPDNPELIAE